MRMDAGCSRNYGLPAAPSASHNHKEAERRRRERINSHLHTLRTLLPCNFKTDKASLLAKVIQRLKELKQQTSDTLHLESFPSETDQITVLPNQNSSGRLLIKASICCQDRSDLIPHLIETLKLLRLRPLRLEMVTIGGRTRNIILVECCHKDDECSHDQLVQFLKESLGSLVEDAGSDRLKRGRV